MSDDILQDARRAIWEAAAQELDEVVTVLGELVDTLPKCDIDPTHGPATKAQRRASTRYCDGCALETKRRYPSLETIPDYPRAPALRKAILLLEKFR